MTKEPGDFDKDKKIINIANYLKTYDKEETEPEVKEETEAEVEGKTQAEPETEVETETQAEPEDEPEIVSESEFAAVPETTADIEAKAESASEPEAEAEPRRKEYKLKSSYNEEEYNDFIYTKYYGRHKGVFSRSGNHNTVDYSSKHNFVKEAHSNNHKRRRHKKWWQKLLIILAWILAGIITLSAIVVGVFFIMKQAGVSQLTGGDVQMTAPVIENAGVSVDNSKNTITYNGTTYAYNSNMTSILCMGIDRRGGLGLTDEIVGTGGQADALYLVALDTKTGETDIIAISRDIYSDIGVYSADGVYTGTENAQLCLAYAYGDGKETSCENTVNAVERLFYNLPINSYFAMDMYAISELNDAVKGVYVTLEDDFLYSKGFYGRAGDTVRLYGDYARMYLQYRDINELSSSVDRMNRQINYLERFTQRAIEMTKRDFSIPADLFNIVKEYSVTNLNASKVSALAYTVVTSGAEVEFKKVPGEVIHNGEFAEYVVDEQGMLELILDVYYEPVN